jgi:hypothetical protein
MLTYETKNTNRNEYDLVPIDGIYKKAFATKSPK